jgi:DNA repair protein SbcC/Rad50
MRPVSLQLKGFTAFRDEQTIDFADLDLFAIWGPTGSGKSSILDAITYALFGKIARIEGIQEETNTSLISQGQPRMAVALEFKVGDEHFKVSRDTRRQGGTTVRLEELDGDEWHSHGEGADSVRQVNKRIPEIIGLNYDAFTRSVILPQGKFAELLVGDATKRRKILTELLGLELFAEMAARANLIARDAKTAADVSDQTLERDYGGVTEEALRAAREQAKLTGEQAVAAESAHGAIRVLLARAVKLGTQRAALERCHIAATEMANDFDRHATDLIDQVAAVADSQARFDDAVVALEKARGTLDAAETELNDSAARWGSREQIMAMRERLAALKTARREQDDALALREEAAAVLVTAGAEVEAASIAQRDAGTKLKEANEIHEKARAAHEEAHRRDLVGTLVAGLEPGAPCPICDRALKTIPESDQAALATVVDALGVAEAGGRRAEAEFTGAKAAVAAAQKSLDGAQTSLKRTEVALAARVLSVANLEKEVGTLFGGEVPLDPGAELDERLRQLDKRAIARDEARAAVEAATLITQGCERDAAEARRQVEGIRTALESAGVRRLIEDIDATAALLTLPRVVDSWPQEPDDLVASARRAASDLAALRDRIQEHRDRLRREVDGLVAEGRAGIPSDLDIDGRTLEELERSAQAELQRTNKEAATAEHEAGRIDDALGKRRELAAEITARREEHSLYKALGNELRSDRIVDYLQAEALSALAAAGSDQLHSLSGGRYRMSYEDDRFFVIDAWNGEERRSVRTLSGGETFLASLALALALADQVQLLAVAERNRLESLFLDEGFGTLDAETLETVVSAIEQLGGDDRLVGVITHVTELAERLPVRVRVEKSPRGSRISLATQEAGTTPQPRLPPR